MRLQVGLPKVFWVDTVDAACYLVNLSPHIKLDGGLLEERWSERKIGLSHLQVLGCMAYVHVDASERSKLDAKVRDDLLGVSTRCQGIQDMGSLGEKGHHQSRCDL